MLSHGTAWDLEGRAPVGDVSSGLAGLAGQTADMIKVQQNHPSSRRTQ